MVAKTDLTGIIFGRLLVLGDSGERRNEKIVWKCVCQNEGNIVLIVGQSLTSGATQSCGCYHVEQASLANSKCNEYDFTNEYALLYAGGSGNIFIFDKEDYGLIKDYYWRENPKDNYLYAHYSRNPFKKIAFHRLIMGFPKLKVDHKDRNKRDNRKSNLREADSTQNSINASIRNDNKSGVIGVRYIGKKWYSKITYYKQIIELGSFINFDEAVYARLLGEKKYFGEFAPQKHLYKKYGVEE